MSKLIRIKNGIHVRQRKKGPHKYSILPPHVLCSFIFFGCSAWQSSWAQHGARFPPAGSNTLGREIFFLLFFSFFFVCLNSWLSNFHMFCILMDDKTIFEHDTLKVEIWKGIRKMYTIEINSKSLVQIS